MPRPISNHGLASLIWSKTAARRKAGNPFPYTLADLASEARLTRRSVNLYADPRRAKPPALGRTDFALSEALGVTVAQLRDALFPAGKTKPVPARKTNHTHNHRRKA